MAETWQEVKRALEQETRKWAVAAPDELKRFHYGLITHSDAGKYAYNQYLGHFVHLYTLYFGLCTMTIPVVRGMARDPRCDLELLKEMLRQITPTDVSYSGQKTLGDMAVRLHSCLDSLGSKDDFAELVRTWLAFVSQLYYWCHWYFPWIAGPSVCPRISREDVKEMQRLLDTA